MIFLVAGANHPAPEIATMTKTPAIKPFKSDRAAKMAMTKAEGAYEDALRADADARRESWKLDCDEGRAMRDAAEAALDVAREYAEAVYAQAQAQGFWVRSQHFGYNPTRDLILANID
jgi:hypothetical protein